MMVVDGAGKVAFAICICMAIWNMSVGSAKSKKKLILPTKQQQQHRYLKDGWNHHNDHWVDWFSLSLIVLAADIGGSPGLAVLLVAIPIGMNGAMNAICHLLPLISAD